MAWSAAPVVRLSVPAKLRVPVVRVLEPARERVDWLVPVIAVAVAVALDRDSRALARVRAEAERAAAFVRAMTVVPLAGLMKVGPDRSSRVLAPSTVIAVAAGVVRVLRRAWAPLAMLRAVWPGPPMMVGWLLASRRVPGPVRFMEPVPAEVNWRPLAI